MKNFVIMVIVVLLFTLFAVANKSMVSIKIATLSIQTPLSLAIIVPIGITLLLFALFYFRIIGKMELIIRDLEGNVEDTQKQVLEITKRKHELEIENRKLKVRLGEPADFDDTSL